MALANITNNILTDSGILVTNLTPTSRTLTINGVTYDLSADRSWTIATGLSGSGTANQLTYWDGTSSVTGSATLTYSPTAQLLVNNSVTAATAIARGVNFTPTLVAAANNDVLVGLDINPTFTAGAFTGLTRTALRVYAQSNTIVQTRGEGLEISSSQVGHAPAVFLIGNAANARSFRLASWQDGSTGRFVIRDDNAGADRFAIFSNGNTAINTTTDAGFRLDVNGTARVQGDTNITGSLGIGTTSLSGYTLRLGKNITGATTAYGIALDTQIQSDVTTQVWGFMSKLSTAAAAFSVAGGVRHFFVNGGVTLGSGSSIGNQWGFYASLGTAGSTNYGFYGDGAAASNVWNLYMAGTANNYLAGSLGIGSTSLTGINFRVFKNVTGATTAYNALIQGAVQSDVTTAVNNITSELSTQATAFTLPVFKHFFASQSTIGAGSTVTTQAGFWANSNLIGATNNYGFYGEIPAQANAWNLFMAGTANNYLAGSLGIGTTNLTGYNIRMGKTITGNADAYGMSIESQIQSDVTTTAQIYKSNVSTAAAAFTLADLVHFWAQQATIGSTSAVTRQYGFYVHSSLTGATNNYGFYGNIASGTNRWNLYMNGTADNYMAGSLGIGNTSLTQFTLRLGKTITGNATSYGIFNGGTIQSDVTTLGTYNRTSASTQATTFTLTDLEHYGATQGSIGAGSTVTNQYGFRAESSLTGATNNYGFYGNIASGTNRWNLYMNGTAANYMAGQTGIGTTTLGSYIFNVGGSVATLVNFNSTNASGFYTTYSTSGTERAYIGLGANTISGLGIADFGIVGSSNVVIASGSSGTETMRVSSGKNLLIGTTTDAGFKLDVNGTARVVNTLTVGSNGVAAGRIELSRAAASAAGYIYMSGNSMVIENAASLIELRPGSLSSIFSVNTNGNTVLSSTGALTDNASSILTINSTTKGFLPPRMTTTQRTAISSPATGLVVYDITDNELDYHNGTAWQSLMTLGTQQTVTGFKQFSASRTASVGVAQGTLMTPTLTAAANNDVLVGLDISPTYTNGAFTGVVNVALRTTTGNVLFATTSGSVGIGSTTPAYKLEVNNSTGDNHIAAVGTTPSLQLMSANSGPANWGTIGMATATNNFIVGASAGDLAIVNRGTTAGNVLFGFGSTEKMRLTSDGVLAIGTTSTSTEGNLFLGAKTTSEGGQLVLQKGTSYTYAAHVDNYQDSFRIISGTDTTSSTVRMSINLSTGDVTFNSGLTAGQITSGVLGTGTVYSNAGVLTNTNPSDRRLKTNIIPLTYGLADILKLNPVSYNWKDGTNGKQFGFIAQEVQEVMPDAVKNGEYLGLEKDAIYSALVNAIKEQQAQINELKSQLK